MITAGEARNLTDMHYKPKLDQALSSILKGIKASAERGYCWHSIEKDLCGVYWQRDKIFKELEGLGFKVAIERVSGGDKEYVVRWYCFGDTYESE